MNRFRVISMLTVGLAAAILAPGGAWANRIPGQVVTGYLTAVGTDSITVDGHSYAVAASSAAADELSSLSPGERVDAQLNGPASSPDAEVINVAIHTGE